MKKQSLAFLLACTFLVVAVSEARACSCPTVGDDSDQLFFRNKVTSRYNRAKSVFIGKVVSNEDRTILFQVKDLWKGPKTNKIVMTESRSSCAYGFKGKGSEYLIFAYETEDGELQTYSCSLTRPFGRFNQERIAKVLNRLGKIKDI